MAGSSILVVVNSLRLERLPDPVPALIPKQRSGTKVERTHNGTGISAMAGPAVERS
ncbi:hypothetical protein [Ensifer aridi]|uniref:hypothetical protein n=1 Tax=Ensifer aridi TaxID=1708715 RepID=UPI000ACFA0B1|nr:hypothetical protein [Ensifer aridi]